MRCQQCGQEVESNNRFCSFCGTEQLAGAGEQLATFEIANSQDVFDSQSEYFLDEDIPYDDEDEYLDGDVTYYSYHEKKPIRWWPIALALFSILLLVGVIIGIWLQFFSNDNKKIQFSDPTTPYKLENTKTMDTTNPQRSDRPNTDLIIETTTSTSTTLAMTTEPVETTTSNSSRPIDIVIVTDPVTTSPTTSLSTTSISASSVESVTSFVSSIPFEESTASSSISSAETTTPITTMSETTTPSTSVEETSTTMPTYPMGFLSIDNVHMDMWPHVRLHYSYIAPQPPVSEPSDPAGDENIPVISTTTLTTNPALSISRPIEEDPDSDVDIPAPFDVRFLSVWESESLDGVWVEQTVEEQKSTAKLLVVADTSKKLIDMVDIESLRHSINHLVESMDFPDESSERIGDALGIMQFSDTSTLLTPLTFERQEAIDAIDEMTQGADRSLLWNSLYLALSETPDKGAILLVTRGEDTGSIITPLYVRAMAQMKGIPIYTIFIKTEESEPIGEREEYFKTFSEITGGRCYVIDATNPDLDIGVGISMGLVTAYEGDRQNKHLSYRSTTHIDFPTRYVKLVYSPEGAEPIESEIVSYVIPEDAAYSANDHANRRMSTFLLYFRALGERIE